MATPGTLMNLGINRAVFFHPRWCKAVWWHLIFMGTLPEKELVLQRWEKNTYRRCPCIHILFPYQLWVISFQFSWLNLDSTPVLPQPCQNTRLIRLHWNWIPGTHHLASVFIWFHWNFRLDRSWPKRDNSHISILQLERHILGKAIQRLFYYAIRNIKDISKIEILEMLLKMGYCNPPAEEIFTIRPLFCLAIIFAP